MAFKWPSYLRLIFVTFVIVSVKTGVSEFNIDDSSLYAIKFNPPEKSSSSSQTEDTIPTSPDEVLLNAPELLQTVTMTTSHNEKYVCQLPKEDHRKNAQDEPYEGPNVLQILGKLFVQSQCAYRLEHFWTYELCHGKYLRQFHEERDGKNIKLTEYFLGNYNKETHDQKQVELETDIKEDNVRKPLTKRIETINMPFYELVMTDGTICDLNGQPRITRVHYVCYPTGKHEIYSLKESSTCEYEVIVLSSLLCSHPDYRPVESSEQFINCRPANDISSTKPLNLIAMDAEALKLRSEKMYQAELFQGDQGPGTVRIEIKPVVPPTSHDEYDEPAADYNRADNWPQRPKIQPLKPLVDPHVVQEFLLGEFCLYGGTGWWKYEFCYGRKVDQYHEEKGAQKTIINLGSFDLNNHKEWLMKNPTKRPKPIESRKFVSHLYSGGDICDLTGKPRQVEVKLKCKQSESPSAVSIYLLEPNTCEYVLGVESPLVCDILASADEDGVMKVTKADFTTTTTTTTTATTKTRATTTTADTKEYIKFTLEDAIDPKAKKDETLASVVETDEAVYDRIIVAKDYDEYDDYDDDADEKP